MFSNSLAKTSFLGEYQCFLWLIHPVILPTGCEETLVLILYYSFLAEVANQMPTVIRVFEATTQRETTKKADCCEGEVGYALWKSVSSNELCGRFFVARTPVWLFSLLKKTNL